MAASAIARAAPAMAFRMACMCWAGSVARSTADLSWPTAADETFDAVPGFLAVVRRCRFGAGFLAVERVAAGFRVAGRLVARAPARMDVLLVGIELPPVII
ncbi:hypothetical protein DPM19_06900 [Actinomadura craniellae]|uniref:Secreted protein n=1 Tax=Actinomadura craniellae TaxID=2231787 RepID=A0A365H8R8_9ACTN|nr:hypothetical protein DPM19_06900 [Actinomadura craniellae]